MYNSIPIHTILKFQLLKNCQTRILKIPRKSSPALKPIDHLLQLSFISKRKHS